MLFKFIDLEWKAFIRSASFKANLFLKIVMVFFGLYFAASFLMVGYFLFDLFQEQNLDPITTMNRYVLYYLFADLGVRFLFQKLPTTHIKPLLSLPISKKKIAKYTLAKSFQSFFVWVHLFLLIPLALRMISEGYDYRSVVLWSLSMFCFLIINNLLNLLLQNKNAILIVVAVFAGATAVIHNFTNWDYLYYFGVFFESFFYKSWLFILPILAILGIGFISYRTYLKNLYLDVGMTISRNNTKNWKWMEGLNTKDPFLQNDIRLILRNKRSRGTLFISLLFLCYGLMFFKDIDINNTSAAVSVLLFSLIITGGFIFTFGQYVPSWDSSYYPLLMSQNIKYKAYLESKWRILVIGGSITGLLSLLYLIKDIQLIYPILAAFAYNIGVNTQLALLTGAYIKTPIDLSQNKNIFGDRKAFNIQSMLISLPMFLLPLLIFITASVLGSPKIGYMAIIVVGILGFVLKNAFFNTIEKLYKKRKYVTLESYKESK